jgi:hypothetical protein
MVSASQFTSKFFNLQFETGNNSNDNMGIALFEPPGTSFPFECDWCTFAGGPGQVVDQTWAPLLLIEGNSAIGASGIILKGSNFNRRGIFSKSTDGGGNQIYIDSLYRQGGITPLVAFEGDNGNALPTLYMNHVHVDTESQNLVAMWGDLGQQMYLSYYIGVANNPQNDGGGDPSMVTGSGSQSVECDGGRIDDDGPNGQFTPCVGWVFDQYSLNATNPITVPGEIGANAGVFTNTQMNQPFQFKIGNPNFTNGGMFATYLSDALVGETLVPSGATVPQADGITTACQSATASVNCVAAYGVGRAGANSQAVWGNNYVAADTDSSGTAHTSVAVIGNEVDIGCSSTTTSCHGLDIHPVLTAGPTVGWGVHLFGDRNNGFQLPFAFLSDNGVATVGLQLGALGTTASQSSQPLNFVSILSSSVTSTSSIQSDALGGLGVTPSNGILSVSSGIGEVSAGGYLPNGVLVSSLPSAAANPGLIKSVTDSTAISAEGQTCVGSSTTKALAFSNGTIWKCF